MQLLSLYLFLLCILSKASCSCISCNDEHGVCINDKCVCRVFYQGDDCSIKWSSQYKHWDAAFQVYRVYVTLFFFALLLTCLVEFSKMAFLSFKNKTRFASIVTVVIIGLTIGSFTRVIQFIIDPHNYNNIFGTEFDGFLYSFPILLWIDCGFIILLYWIELVSHSKMVELLFVQKLRIPLIAFSIITAIVLIPISVVNVLYRTVLINSLYNATMGCIMLLLIIVLIYAGSRFIKVVNQVWKSTREPHFREFLKRTTYSIFALAACMIMVIIAAILFPFFALKNAWWFLGLHFILRTAECGSIVCLLIAIIKKKPRKESAFSRNSKESEVPKSDDNSVTEGAVSLP